MKQVLLTGAAFALSISGALAGGLDRTFTPVDIIFEEGNYVEVSWGYASPTITGTDGTLFGGRSIADVADNFAIYSGAARFQIMDNIAIGLILDQPYGVDIAYGSDSIALGGTLAKLDTSAQTALLQYQFNENFSVYGGARRLAAEGNVTLSGAAYGALSGSTFVFNNDVGWGYVAGAAYERPELAQRVSLTYHSAINLDFATTETTPFTGGIATQTGTTRSKVPQAVELGLQTGINPNTLIFGSIRWSDWGPFSIIPPAFSGIDLANLTNVWTYEIGVGRKINDKLSASLTYTHESANGNNLVSPLSPYNGLNSISLGAKYQMTDKVSLSGGVRYTKFGDAQPSTSDTARASMSNNSAISVGFKLGISLD